MSVLQTICQSGDSVVLPTPHYFNQAMTCSLLSISTLPLACHPPSFVPSVEEARKLIEFDQEREGKCRAIVLVTPNNPTGAIYPPDVLAGEVVSHPPLVLRRRSSLTKGILFHPQTSPLSPKKRTWRSSSTRRTATFSLPSPSTPTRPTWVDVEGPLMGCLTIMSGGRRSSPSFLSQRCV